MLCCSLLTSSYRVHEQVGRDVDEGGEGGEVHVDMLTPGAEQGWSRKQGGSILETKKCV